MTKRPVLIKEAILVNQAFETIDECLEQSGKLLVDNGYIEPEYILSMKEKVEQHPYTTYLPGAGVLQIPNGIDWLGEKVFIVIAIAANSDEHMNVLASLGDSLESEEDAKNLWKTNSVDKIYDILS
jgi:mannitol/fructose-specific phosphotransferase system IIA component